MRSVPVSVMFISLISKIGRSIAALLSGSLIYELLDTLHERGVPLTTAIALYGPR